MKESRFVKQNSSKWQDYEQLESKDPDLLAERYIEITDDLSFAKTFFPDSGTTAFLNGLAAKFHQNIYKNKKENTGRFIAFWKTELPLIFGANRRLLLYAFLFFTTFALIGALSAKYDDTFVNLVMGPGYVNMTNENISKGDPFGVYKGQNEFVMFLNIASNNIRVSFIAFILGIFLSVGTVFMLIRNGIMIGSFQYFFFSKGLGLQSILVIWIHGTIEISSIVIAGAAGLVLGNSILFPGTYTRLISFMKGAKTGMKMIVGLIPLFIIAAFLESFVTRHTEMPFWLSFLILAGSLAFMVWYVIIYPYRLLKKLKSVLTLP